MPSLRYTQIAYKDELAGTLQETPNGGSRFEYAATYHKSEQPVGLCIPVQPRTHEWNSGLHPFFQHVLPEGRLRREQAAQAGLEAEDDFGLLLAYGGDCIGAVSVVSEPAPQSSLSVGADRVDAPPPGRTISGVQLKLLGTRDRQGYRAAVPGEPAPFILKLSDEALPQVVANEDLALEACRVLLGSDEVTYAERTWLADRQNVALAVRRFDRTPTNDKLRMEDFAQILCRPRGVDFTGKYQGSYEECAEVIDRYSAQPKRDIVRLFRRVVAFALLGNCDAHLKNFALIETQGGLRLAPCYDVVNTIWYATSRGYSTEFALSFAGEKLPWELVGRDVLDRWAREIGVPSTTVSRAFRAMQSRESALFGLLRNSSPIHDPEEKLRYEDIVRSAWLRLFPL